MKLASELASMVNFENVKVTKTLIFQAKTDIIKVSKRMPKQDTEKALRVCSKDILANRKYKQIGLNKL